MPTKLAVPETPEDLQETLMNKAKLKTLMDEGSFPEFMTNYAKSVNKADPGLSEKVDEQVQQALASFSKENGISEFRKGERKLSAQEIRAQKQSGAFWSKQAEGAALDGKFADLMEFLTVANTTSDPRDEKIATARKLIKNAMSSTDPASGGFLIPEEFRRELLMLALEAAIVRPRARVIPMAALRATIPSIDATTNNGSVFGGVIGYWTEEGAALVQSQPNFGRVVLEAKKLTAYTEVPNELGQDSAVSLEALLGMLFPGAIRRFEDRAFLLGTGVGEPIGVLNATNGALVTQAAEAGQATGTIVWENLINMFSRMLPDSLSSAVWMVPPSAFPQLATMALSVGTGGSAVWLNNGVEGPPATILGRPVIITEMAADLGTAGDVSFVDLNQYLIGDRMAMDAQVSTDFKFGNDMTAYRFIERVDGRPWMQSAITPQNGSTNTLSPYVRLAARP